jgi:membrane-associated phospholipid phosphatase
MITYGILLALTYTWLAVYPFAVKALIAGITFTITAVIPGLLILLMVRSGAASDTELSDRRERAVPYLIFITSLLVCLFYFHKMRLPFWLSAVIIGCCVALVTALFINFAWKISSHTLGTGGFLGGVMGGADMQMINPFWCFILVIIIGGLVAMSRIYLKRHTPMQAYAGFALGFLSVFGVLSMSYTYLFN